MCYTNLVQHRPKNFLIQGELDISPSNAHTTADHQNPQHLIRTACCELQTKHRTRKQTPSCLAPPQGGAAPHQGAWAHAQRRPTPRSQGARSAKDRGPGLQDTKYLILVPSTGGADFSALQNLIWHRVRTPRPAQRNICAPSLRFYFTAPILTAPSTKPAPS